MLAHLPEDGAHTLASRMTAEERSLQGLVRSQMGMKSWEKVDQPKRHALAQGVV